MQTTKEISRTGRRRTGKRHRVYYRIRNRVGTSYGQPVHISSYINPLMGADGNIDREKFINFFNSECYG